MISFDLLVEDILTESPSPSSEPPLPEETDEGPISAALAERGDIEDFIDRIGGDLINKFQAKYGIIGIPLNINNLKEIAYVAMENRKRATKTYNEYDNFDYIFPFLDLFANLTPYFLSTASSSSQRNVKVPQIINQWYERLNNTRSNIPLDYAPSNAWAKRVKQSFYSNKKSEKTLGTISLDQKINSNGKLSFYWLALDLTEPYSHEVSRKLPSAKSTLATLFSDVHEEVKKILTQVQILASSPKDINLDNAKIDKFYDRTLFNKILNVAVSLYQLYLQQLNQVLGNNSGLEVNQQCFNSFIGIEGKDRPVDFVWSNFATVRESVVNDFYKKMVTEGKHNYFKILSEEFDDKEIVDKVYYLKDELPPGAELKTAIFNYTAENLRIAAKNNHPQSVNLINAFEQLNSFIRIKTEPEDPDKLLNTLRAANLGIAGGL